MDPIAGELRDITLAKVVKWVCATVMIFGGVVPYIPQYREIYIKEDAEGFSMYVCLALLIANTLRILFWFGKRYELPLLVQSIIMNILMLAMIHLCVRVRNKHNLVSMRGQDKYFTDHSLQNPDEHSEGKLKTPPPLARSHEKTSSIHLEELKVNSSEPKTHNKDLETNIKDVKLIDMNVENVLNGSKKSVEESSVESKVKTQTSSDVNASTLLDSTSVPVETTLPKKSFLKPDETIIGVENSSHPLIKRRPLTTSSAANKDVFIDFAASQTDIKYLFGRAPWIPLGSFHRKSYFDWRYFWQWTDFQSYLDFLLALSISLSLLTFLCINSTVFIECLGFMAVFTEAMLGVPQLLKNLRSRSTEGMSILMVLMWTAGDAFKTVYFVVREAPLQFWICGTLQVLIDMAILGQVYWYRNNTTGYRNDRVD